jgi:hypothetical protein
MSAKKVSLDWPKAMFIARLAEGHVHRSLGHRPRKTDPSFPLWPKAMFIVARGHRPRKTDPSFPLWPKAMFIVAWGIAPGKQIRHFRFGRRPCSS